jgi:hypothetical protein
MMLSLTPITAAAAGGGDATEPEGEPLKIGTVPVVIIDETTGSEFTQTGGKVTLPQYAYYGNFVREKYYVSRGDTVTVLAVPEEGWVIGSLRVTYKTSLNGPDRDLPLDEATSTVMLPGRGPVSMTIYVSFVSTLADDRITVTVVDGGTGNTVTASRDRADEGEEITVTVNMNPGTRFTENGLIAHRAGDASVTVELTKADESTYTFVMPAYGVDILARFETAGKPGDIGSVFGSPGPVVAIVAVCVLLAGAGIGVAVGRKKKDKS